MSNEKELAFGNLVTMICKECIKHGFTLDELERIQPLVKKFYYDNAVPFKH
ncbi:hypothetical protein [Bacillus atrophaeus]|uniref:hypothetical protein n=1 Tax=Bacillus atrophaeus TaxID=1452 RepID=UPI002E1C73B4|nr:hypothetical protein [Bacillus atrophaeus]